jgi:ankyrin repeat protein
MDAKQLPSRLNLEQYKKLAKDFLKAYKSSDAEVIQRAKKFHPRSRQLLDSDTPKAQFGLADAQLVIAREHAFDSWPMFKEHIEALTHKSSRVSKFESAVEAVITGNAAELKQLLRGNPELTRERSTRAHHATLLHYVSANGVEDFRQKTPKNAVEITKILLSAGADVEAAADAYGKRKTLDLVATSIYPARAGVQIALMETLLDAGAAIEGFPEKSIVNSCLANGRPQAANFLVRRGARLDLEGAAGVGRLDLVQGFFNQDGSLKANATKVQMESGFMWACEYGQTNVVEFLLDLDQGVDVGTQVDGMTGLHWAVIGGHLDTIKLLLERKAQLEVKNRYGGTTLEQTIWAIVHSDAETDWVAIVEMLLAAGARVEGAGYPSGSEQVDEVLRRHGAGSGERLV